MDLLEIEEKREMRREEAAKLLHRIADTLERQNDVQFVREGLKFTIDVPDQVQVELELEVGDDGTSFEIEINW
ncbi:MAG: amphi-Trp domain-containing protein [Betaproteobacteria bacterium]|nr:MAG: amphi-Trp domain-containing protein [Betaproteobacteria bacterium]